MTSTAPDAQQDRLLLDTHVWLWWQMRPERIAADVRARIADANTEVFLSSVSSWEMAIKIAAGRLQLPQPLDALVPESLLADEFRGLAIHHDHCFELGKLPMHHRDPFDRMLVAQARREKLTLVTADMVLQQYDVNLMRADR